MARALPIGRTLGTYVSTRFLRAVLGVLAALFAIVFILDFVETMRRAGDVPGASALTVAEISLFRTPSVVEQTIPFAVLFGSMGAFLALSRRLELVVARAAGVSAWGFLTPPLVLAAVLGLVVALVYNPIAAELRARCDAAEAILFSTKRDSQPAETVRWIRQRAADGQQAVIRAASGQDDGTGSVTLLGATFFTFDRDGRFQRRIEARQARLIPGSWQLADARVLEPGQTPQAAHLLAIPTDLTAAQVQQTFASPDRVPFWRLPSSIRLARAAGLDANEYRLQFQSLLARPALLVAMVLIAACVSLRFVRVGGVGLMLLGGAVAGFVLYVVTKMAGDLGAAGLVNPSAAAWTPACLGLAVGFSVLLNQEDG